jgi:hypothetical protein
MNRVKAELSYNPYLLETCVKFNGQVPKINSLVEKYRAGKLQGWIAKLPDIFYNEMNGWDFDLDFYGTKIDFESLQAAFDAVGVNRDSVCVFHKNELECVERKSVEIADLLAWFENNPNRKFTFADFRQTNAPLFDTGYSFVIVQGPPCEPVFDEVTIENVPDISELEQAVLENTPILFYINEQNRREFRNNLTNILKHGDVGTEQLFFCINPDLNRSQVERVIRDLGVESPQIVESSSDDVIKRYLEVYPMTAYVQQVIGVLRGVQSEYGAVLQAENEQSIKINSTIHQKIDCLDEVIQKLKSANGKITQRDNFETPAGLTAAKNDFVQKVANWRKKKIKITSDSEAGSIAVEFDKEAHDFFKDFIRQISVVFQSNIEAILKNFALEYSLAGFNDNYVTEQELHIDLSGYDIPKLIEGLLELKKEQYVQQSDSPFNIFKNVFGNAPSPETRELKLEVTYLYQEWRDYAIESASPIMDTMIQSVSEALAEFYRRVAEDYLEHLKLLIEQQTELKDGVTAQLSDDERKLQEDNDWFSVFCEKLREIERG